MLSYTKGEAHSKLICGGIAGVLDTYRGIAYKGKNAPLTTLMQKRMRVMSPSAAKDITEVEAKLTAWKSDIRYLQEANADQDRAMLNNMDQMATILISIMPAQIQEYLITKYEEGDTKFEELENLGKLLG